MPEKSSDSASSALEWLICMLDYCISERPCIHIQNLHLLQTERQKDVLSRVCGHVCYKTLLFMAIPMSTKTAVTLLFSLLLHLDLVAFKCIDDVTFLRYIYICYISVKLICY